MLVDGRSLAREVFQRTRTLAQKLASPPTLAALMQSRTAATRSYLSIKAAKAKEAGVRMRVVDLSSETDANGVIRGITQVSDDALIVQLPLAASVDSAAVLNAVPLEKDADVLSDAARARFASGAPDALSPPVASAIAHILDAHDVSVRGKRAVVVGRGLLVGQPAAALLARRGALVTVVSKREGDLAKALADADIVVSGAGVPGLVRPEHVRDGVVLIDAGTSGAEGSLAGDVHKDAFAKASLATPVPGGVGPLTVAYLFSNAVELARRAREPVRNARF